VQKLFEDPSYNLSSWRWAWYCSKHVEDYDV